MDYSGWKDQFNYDQEKRRDGMMRYSMGRIDVDRECRGMCRVNTTDDSEELTIEMQRRIMGLKEDK